MAELGSRVPERVEAAWTPALQLFGLWAFAVAQPLFDLLARHAEFLVARRMTGGEILGMTTALALAGPLVLWTLRSVASLLSQATGRTAHLAMVGALSLLTLLPLAKRITAIPQLVGLGCCALAAAAVVYLTWRVSLVG